MMTTRLGSRLSAFYVTLSEDNTEDRQAAKLKKIIEQLIAGTTIDQPRAELSSTYYLNRTCNTV